jgi:hypothetical protein
MQLPRHTLTFPLRRTGRLVAGSLGVHHVCLQLPRTNASARFEDLVRRNVRLPRSVLAQTYASAAECRAGLSIGVHWQLSAAPVASKFMRSHHGAALRNVAIVAIFAAGLAGCSTSRSTVGTISGTAEPCAGVLPASTQVQVPLVSVMSRARVVATRRNLISPWRFTFAVPPGDYQVRARYDQSVSVHVERGKSITVALRSGCK